MYICVTPMIWYHIKMEMFRIFCFMYLMKNFKLEFLYEGEIEGKRE